MTIITLGGLSGGGARTLGPSIARAIDADYVDRLILADVARHVGATVEALHQREERPPTRGERLSRLLQRILERSAVTGAGGDPYFGPGVAAFLTEEYEDIPQATITRGHELEDDKYIEGVQKVLTEMAEGGNVVFVGRGAYVILKDMPSVLRVGIEANLEDRIATIMERERLGHDEAAAVIIERDNARGYYFKKFFDMDHPDDPSLFHFVINTSDVNHDYAVDVIVDACKAMQEGRLEPKNKIGSTA
jgi:cytidylate kinase